MRNVRILLSLIISALLLNGCAKQSFDYASAYKFKVNQMHKKDAKTAEAIPVNHETSLNAEINNVNPVLEFSETESSEIIAGIQASATNSKEESRMVAKAKKLEQRIAKKIKKMESKTVASRKSVNAKVYTGVVIGAAGLILFILFGGTLGTIGALGVLVGLIFIVWGLLE